MRRLDEFHGCTNSTCESGRVHSIQQTRYCVDSVASYKKWTELYAIAPLEAIEKCTYLLSHQDLGENIGNSQQVVSLA